MARTNYTTNYTKYNRPINRQVKSGKFTIPEVSKETLKLQSFIEKQEDGREISFQEIEKVTGVVMDYKGKQYLRSAIRRCKREYSSIHGYGLRLADTGDVMPILTNRLVKVDRAVKRGEKSQKLLQEQFFQSLSPGEQKDILFIGACFGAIRVAAENGKIIYQKKEPKQKSSGVSIPYKT